MQSRERGIGDGPGEADVTTSGQSRGPCVMGHDEVPVEEGGQHAEPAASTQAVVGRHHRPGRHSTAEGGDAARPAAGLMGVHDVRTGEGERQPGGQRVDGMAMQATGAAQGAHLQPARLAGEARDGAERDELDVHVAHGGAGELEGVALAATEQPAGAERRRRDVNDPHLLVSLLTLGDPRRVTGGNLYDLRLAEAAADHGATLTFASYPHRSFPWPAIASRRVRRSALDADVVVIDSIVAAYAAPWAIPLARRRPVVALVHQPPGGMEGTRGQRVVQGVLDRALYRCAAAVVAASESLAEDLLAAGVPPERVTVAPPGADDLPVLSQVTGGADGIGQLDLRGGRRAALLAAGAWVPRKGILELLEAFARLPPSAATLHLAGDTEADRRYTALVRRRLAAGDLADRVVVHGVVAPSEMRALYRAADGFVLASTVEPYGTVYGEALAAGLPVIGWRAGNLPHLITEGREGLMADAGDIDGLARALLEVSTDEQRRADLAAAAAARGARLPTWDATCAAFFAVVRARAGRKRPAPSG